MTYGAIFVSAAHLYASGVQRRISELREASTHDGNDYI